MPVVLIISVQTSIKRQLAQRILEQTTALKQQQKIFYETLKKYDNFSKLSRNELEIKVIAEDEQDPQ